MIRAGRFGESDPTSADDKDESAWFEKLILRQTLESLPNSGSKKKPRKSKTSDAVLKKSRLTDFYYGAPGVNGGFDVSGWAKHWTFKYASNAVLGSISVGSWLGLERREWRFRIVRGEPGKVAQMVLRLETHLRKRGLNSFVKRVFLPFSETNWMSGADKFFFSQEQRLKDINLNRGPEAPTLWIWAFRPEKAGHTPQALTLLNGLTKMIAQAKRRVHDGSPISFLPDRLRSRADPLPWHIHGVLKDSYAWQRSLDADPPNGDTVDPAWRAWDKFDLDIRGLEPRANPDMWAGHEDDVREETVSGRLPRVVSSPGEGAGSVVICRGPSIRRRAEDRKVDQS